jgi:hypothetical protein
MRPGTSCGTRVSDRDSATSEAAAHGAYTMFRVWGLGFRVGSLGYRVWDSEFRVNGLGFRVYSIGYAV